jgi:hypothetical protein
MTQFVTGATDNQEQGDTMSIAAAMKRIGRILCFALAAALPWLASEARAGCGTIVTLNPTDHWVWITIYDVGETIHMDYGFVQPHSARKWTGGGSPLPYACGSFYHVRYEVKSWKGKSEPPSGDPNVFDTRMQINPQLTLSDIVQLFHSLGSLLTCVTPTLEGACLAEFGIDEAGQTLLLGAIGSDSNNSVVCIKTSDSVNYFLENSGNCALKPPTGKLPPKPADKYSFQPASHSVGIGMNQRSWYFNIAKNGTPIQDNSIYAKGRFYTDNPGIATFPDPHNGHIKGVKAGKTTAHWDFDNKRQASAEIDVK